MKANGRVDILNASNNTKSYDNTPKVYTSSFKDALTGILENSTLSTAYFSVQNQQIIQNGIRAGVYKLSNNKYVIAQQRDTDIKIVMRTVYLNHCEHKNENIKGQIEKLNQHVFDFCIPRIYSEAQGYVNYLRDASTLVVPMARPIYTSTNKTLELKPFF